LRLRRQDADCECSPREFRKASEARATATVAWTSAFFSSIAYSNAVLGVSAFYVSRWVVAMAAALILPKMVFDASLGRPQPAMKAHILLGVSFLKLVGGTFERRLTEACADLGSHFGRSSQTLSAVADIRLIRCWRRCKPAHKRRRIRCGPRNVLVRIVRTSGTAPWSPIVTGRVSPL
jgi:hypothetical protein